jgi:ribosomal protein L20
LQNAGVLINRKFLSEIAVNDEPGFKKLVEIVQAHK